jgi:membrane protein YqaA with SNARE-associated domain
MGFESFILQFGYLGLFVVSFLASTVLPLSTELIVVVMPAMGFNIWLVGIIATLGNYLGALTMYYMGWYGTDFVLSRYVTIEQDKVERAQEWFRRWGPPALLLSWVPFIGDPLCAVAGSLKMPVLTFTVWTIIGKGLRYVVLLGAVYNFI